VWKVGFEKIVKPVLKQAPDKALIAAGTADFAAAARVLNDALAEKDYVANKLSIADFAIGPFIGLATGPCELEIAAYRNLSLWRDRMNARESIRQTMVDARAAASVQRCEPLT
jgi:glutathione S-transferase